MKKTAPIILALVLFLSGAAQSESVTLLCICENNNLLVFSDNSVFKVFPGEMKDPSQWKAFAICTLHRRRCGNEELSSYDIVNSITNDKITAVRLY